MGFANGYATGFATVNWSMPLASGKPRRDSDKSGRGAGAGHSAGALLSKAPSTPQATPATAGAANAVAGTAADPEEAEPAEGPGRVRAEVREASLPRLRFLGSGSPLQSSGVTSGTERVSKNVRPSTRISTSPRKSCQGGPGLLDAFLVLKSRGHSARWHCWQ